MLRAVAVEIERQQQQAGVRRLAARPHRAEAAQLLAPADAPGRGAAHHAEIVVHRQLVELLEDGQLVGKVVVERPGRRADLVGDLPQGHIVVPAAAEEIETLQEQLAPLLVMVDDLGHSGLFSITRVLYCNKASASYRSPPPRSSPEAPGFQPPGARRMRKLSLAVLASSLLAACAGSSGPCDGVTGTCVAIAANATESVISAAFVQATANSTIASPAATFKFTNSLNLASVKGVTIKGAGIGSTILDFSTVT